MDIVNNNELREALAKLEVRWNDLENLRNAYDKSRREIIDEFCPIKPDEVITLSSRFGKERRLHVDTIQLRVIRKEEGFPGNDQPVYDFVCLGRLLRKDRTVGRRKGWYIIKVNVDE